MNIIGILTAQTCGEACWHAHEEDCRCSCGGRNHGILNTPGGQRPARHCRIQGHVYTLAAVGGFDDLAGQAGEINRQAGYKMIEPATLVIDGVGMSRAESTPDRAAAARAAGLKVWWSQYHYSWRMTDTGTPARVREVSSAQLAGWGELAPFRGERGRPAVLWVRETMPERPAVLMVDKETGLPLPAEMQIPVNPSW